MHKVIVTHVNAVRAIELKDSLIAAGLVTDIDFVWSYYQARYDEFSHAGVDPSSAVFEFRDPSHATFYQLKWS